jgi:adenylate kinase family enzyme
LTHDPLKSESQNAAPQGSGKGTLSARLVQKYDLHFISTGDVLRKEIMQGSEIGREAEEVVKSGGESRLAGSVMLNTEVGLWADTIPRLLFLYQRNS